MKILVTGGAGYIGSHTVYELIRDGHDVIVLDNLSTGNVEAINKDAKFYQGNLEDQNLLNKIFKENNIDVVIHCSAKLIVPESVEQPIAYFENNVHGVAILLQAMKDNSLKNIVFSSTAAVYGETNAALIEEDDLKAPVSPYGQSKLACEWLIQAAKKAYGFNYVIFRYFNVAGADASLEVGQSTKGCQLTHLIPVINETALGIREELKVFGDSYPTRDGSCIRDYIHVSDLAEAHIKGALYTMENKSNVFNLGSQSGFSVKEVISETSKVLGQGVSYQVVAPRKGDPAQLIASSSRAKKELNFKPKYKLQDMIKTDLEWRKNKKF